MKRFYIIEAIVLAALVLGFIIGRATMNEDRRFENYYDEAAKVYQKAVELDTPPVGSDEPKRLKKVLGLYRKVFDKYRDSSVADDALFTIASRIPPGEEDAFILLRRLIREYPDSDYVDDALYTIAMGHFEKKNYDRALREFSRLIEEYPTSPLVDESKFNRAMCYYGLQDWDKAMEEFVRFEEEYRGSELMPAARFYIGMVYYNRQEYDKALVEFKNIADLANEKYSPKALFQIGLIHFNRKEYDEAIKSFREVTERYPNDEMAEEAQFNIAWTYDVQGKKEEALQEFQNLLIRYPNSRFLGTTYRVMARIYLKLKEPEKAVEMYRKIVEDKSFDYDTRRSAQYAIGRIYENESDYVKAIQEYERLLKDFPEPHSEPAHPSNEIDEGYINRLKDKISKLG